MVKHNCDYHDYMNKDGNEGGLKDKVYIHTYIHNNKGMYCIYYSKDSIKLYAYSHFLQSSIHT